MHRSRVKFKIGITIDIGSRTDTLTRDWGEFDLSESYAITDGALDISRLEKTLHFMFRQWNITNETDTGGHTEWFKIECLQNAVDEIVRIGTIQGSGRRLVKGVTLASSRTSGASQKSTKLAHVLFKEYRYRALQLLLSHPEDSYHVRQIARLTETTVGSLHRELRELADAGLFKREEVGNQVHYRANTDCVIYEELMSILTKI